VAVRSESRTRNMAWLIRKALAEEAPTIVSRVFRWFLHPSLPDRVARRRPGRPACRWTDQAPVGNFPLFMSANSDVFLLCSASPSTQAAATRSVSTHSWWLVCVDAAASAVAAALSYSAAVSHQSSVVRCLCWHCDSVL